jgi:hypothetical protein
MWSLSLLSSPVFFKDMAVPYCIALCFSDRPCHTFTHPTHHSLLNPPNTFILKTAKIATVMFTEMLENIQHSMQLVPERRTYILNSSNKS